MHLYNPCGASDEDNLVNVALIDTTFSQSLFDRAHGNAEVIHVRFVNPCTRQSAREIDAPNSESLSIVACVDDESLRFARSH